MLSPTNSFLPPKEIIHKVVSIIRYLVTPKLGAVCLGANRKPGMPPLPFGVTRYPPAANFWHTLRPLADWEYLHYDDCRGKRHSIEILYRKWDTLGEGLFRTAAPGLEMTVAFQFEAGGFNAKYTLHNLGTEPLSNLTLMIGAPGFADRRIVDDAWSGSSHFSAQGYQRSFYSYDNVNEEAHLLTQASAGPGEPLDNVLRLGGQLYQCRAEGAWTKARCAHVNKRRYLTSHVYGDYAALPAGASLHLTVHHRLVRD